MFTLFNLNALWATVVENLNTSEVAMGDYVPARLNDKGQPEPERDISNKALFYMFKNGENTVAVAPKTCRDIGKGVLIDGIEATATGFKITDGTRFWFSNDPYFKAGVAVQTIAPRGGASKNAV